VAVTDANKAEYLAQLLDYELVGQRFSQLDALREGFTGRLRLDEHFKDFSPADLMVLFGSPTHLDAGMVIETLRFGPAEWGKSGTSPKHLRQLLEEATPTFLRRFLVACTGQSVVPGSAAPGGAAAAVSPRHKQNGLNGIIRVDKVGGPADARQGATVNPLEQRLLLQEYASLPELRAALLAAMAPHCT